ncbi:MAG: hypothetical protein RAO92_03280 [Candidatus Euphemobacter frigidus]|nr:hypothetical protein [Candidatus Euphemobacter frigidus]MDP8275403.1 hypothetical protein [Candidatus Euphemobacter frigidus]
MNDANLLYCNIMVGKSKARSSQKEFLFDSAHQKDFLSNPPRPRNLGRLPVAVLEVSTRAKNWLRAHGISNIDQLIKAEKEKVISRQCLDNQIRKELHSALTPYWNGKKYKYIIALNFIEHGVDKALSQSRIRKASLKRLSLPNALRQILQKKRIQTIGQLFLQEELRWRNPRSLGNILVNEILISLSTFLNSLSSD